VHFAEINGAKQLIDKMNKKNKAQRNNQGVALIVTILLMSLILFLSLYFLDFSLTEKYIASSQTWGAKTYYLAEAGIAEMIWKLKNDETYKNNFESDPDWVASFTRNNPFGENSGSYTATITNSSLANGEIVASGNINVGDDYTAQRVIQTQVYKALGGLGIGGSSGYANGNVDISSSRVNFFNGDTHSNNVFTVNAGSEIYVERDLKAVGNYIESLTSTSTIGGEIYAANYPNGPAEEINMPAIDFDSAATSSYKNMADIIYSENDFEDLMWANQNLTLNDAITYVEGDVELRGAQNLIINGLLVIEKDLNVGQRESWGARSGYNSITINYASGTPAGILAKSKVEFKAWTGNIDIDGIIYASDSLNILNFSAGYNFDVTGAIMGRKLTITSSWDPINITHNSGIVSDGLGISSFSPIITIEHWEEEY